MCLDATNAMLEVGRREAESSGRLVMIDIEAAGEDLWPSQDAIETLSPFAS